MGLLPSFVGWESERDRQTDTDRPTDRQTDRQTDRRTIKQINRQTNRQTEFANFNIDKLDLVKSWHLALQLEFPGKVCIISKMFTSIMSFWM